MSVQLLMFEEATSKGSGSAIFLQGSVAGASRCASPVGPTTGPSGPAPAPVSPSPAPAISSAMRTVVTSGPRSALSLLSAALCESLASRLRARLERVGSMEYAQTWRRKATPAGLLFWEHTASGRRTSDRDFTGWPTPSSEGSAGETSADLERVGNKWRNRKTGRILQTNLATDVKMLVGWATCSSRDWKDTPGMATTEPTPTGECVPG